MSDLVKVFYDQTQIFNTTKLKSVSDNQTVQQVLDSITDASETNKYLVLVPSGHELEYFDWKPNVEVKFLDNLDERWQLDELEGWDDLSNWDIGSRFVAEVINEDNIEKIRLTSNGSGDSSIAFKDFVDGRKFQGIIFGFEFDCSEVLNTSLARLRVIFPNGDFKETKLWVNVGQGNYCRNSFLAFGTDYLNFAYLDENSVDWSNVKIKIIFDSQITDTDAVIKVYNFKYVRVLPYPAVHVHISFSSMSVSEDVTLQFVQELLKRNIFPSFGVRADKIRNLTCNNTNHLSLDFLQHLLNQGVDIVSCFSYSSFTSLNEEETLFEINSSRNIFNRAGITSALQWYFLPYNTSNPFLENELRNSGNILSPLIFGLPVASVREFDNFLHQLQVLKMGGVYLIKFYSSNLSSEDQLSDIHDTIDLIKQKCRFISLKDIENICQLSKDLSNFPQPVLYHTFSDANETMDVCFYHRKMFLNPNGYEINLYVNYVGMKRGDKVFIANIGNDGNLRFDPTGINVTIPPSGSYEFIYY